MQSLISTEIIKDSQKSKHGRLWKSKPDFNTRILSEYTGAMRQETKINLAILHIDLVEKLYKRIL